MSILLESLNQSKKSEDYSPDNNVPGVEDSHFDDEMLSDEWLLKKLLYWKIISGLLLALLLASWVFFYIYPVINVNKLEQNIASSEQQDIAEANKKQNIKTTEVEEVSKSASDTSNVAQIAKVAEKTVEDDKNVAKNSSELEQKENNIKQKYQPKKLKSSTDQNQVNKSQVNKNQVTIPKNESQQSQQAVEFESLSESEKRQLPELEISSYAVSSNAEKSFVVLNGAFYGQGEVIAPHLFLVLIDKEGILIRYKGKLIRKKYSL